MYYIDSTANENGNYGNPQSNPFPDSIDLPDELLTDYINCRGFAVLTVADGIVTAAETNQEALDAYLAEFPDTSEEPEELQPTLDERMTTAEENITDLEDAVQILLDGRTE